MPLFKKTLVPTDFSPCAERALNRAMQLATPGSEVVLLHVFAFPYDWYYRAIPGVESLKKEVEETAKSTLRKLASTHAKDDVVVTHRFDANSHVSRRILSVIEEEAPDLVVMGTKGWGDEHSQLGSVAEQIARQSEKPVLVVPQNAEAFGKSPRILAPLYASATSAGALQYGERLAEALNGRVDILHVLLDAPFGPPFLGDEPIEAGDLLEPEYRLKRLEKFVGRYLRPETEFSIHLEEGDLIEEVAVFVEDTGIDIVVLARPEGGARPPKAESIARRVACPVLVVPAKTSFPQDAATAAPADQPEFEVSL